MSVMIVLGVFLAVVVLVIGYVVVCYNKGISLKNYVKEAFSTMDVYLKKRWDLIPNLVETTKGYAQHEKSTLEEVIKMRNVSYAGLSQSEKIDLNTKLSGFLSKLMAVSESYPELKANENFKNLASELSSLEEDIAMSRKYYNGTVREFNNFLEYFPTNIIGSMFGFRKEAFFEISSEERNNVQIKF